jgi:hypothetical protein
MDHAAPQRFTISHILGDHGFHHDFEMVFHRFATSVMTIFESKPLRGDAARTAQTL